MKRKKLDSKGSEAGHTWRMKAIWPAGPCKWMRKENLALRTGFG